MRPNTSENRITSYNVCYTKLLRIAEHSDIDNSMGALARELYLQHQAAGNGKLDFSSILKRLGKGVR